MTYSASPFGPSIPLVYIETTIPPGMTIDEYWRSRPQRRSRWHRLLQYARSVARSARWRPRTWPDEAPQPVRSPAQESRCRRRHGALTCDRPARASSRLLLVAGRESCTSEHRPRGAGRIGAPGARACRAPAHSARRCAAERSRPPPPTTPSSSGDRSTRSPRRSSWPTRERGHCSSRPRASTHATRCG
jgi:hypothetical protein